MRAREFVREDTFTPAQQAAQRAGMGTKAWVTGPAAAAEPLAKTLAKKAWEKLPYVGAALSVDDAIDRWNKGDRTGAVISTLAAIGYIVPNPMGWVVASGLDMANSQRDAGLVPDIAPGADYIPTQKTMKQPWDHP